MTAMAFSQQPRDDFAVFILTHGRPDGVLTLQTLEQLGYRGKLWLVVDDEDETLPAYRAKYGDARVLVFNKAKYRALTDDGDNFPESRSVIYARNACWDLAAQVGVDYFVQLDDDYRLFFVFNQHTLERVWVHYSITEIFMSCLRLLEATGADSVALAQGGDYIGGPAGIKSWVHRKVMNSFFCTTAKRFWFCSKLNDDVSTYCEGNRRGMLFLTTKLAHLHQQATQQREGGLTSLYLTMGTYTKSFYSVMYCPSAVRVSMLVDGQSGIQSRIHHKVSWRHCAPQILPASYRKPRPT